MVGFSGFAIKKEPLIRVIKACKEYASGPAMVKALRPATMGLEPGEFVLLQGPSGSGKTTLLSIMGCLMKPTSGRVFLCGKDVTDMGESQLPKMRLQHIGFIFQTFNLFPALTAFQNVTLALRLKGYGWRQRRREAKVLLDRVGLGACMDRKPSDLSGGQRQRICIARALAGNADIILADEPTAALDTATGLSIMELLKEETRSGKKAALIVTHDPRLERFATRVDRITDGMLTVGQPPRIRSAGPGNESGLNPSPIPPIPEAIRGVSSNTPLEMPGITVGH
jgi:putative ABC transport system ATP-binding protein